MPSGVGLDLAPLSRLASTLVRKRNTPQEQKFMDTFLYILAPYAQIDPFLASLLELVYTYKILMSKKFDDLTFGVF